MSTKRLDRLAIAGALAMGLMTLAATAQPVVRIINGVPVGGTVPGPNGQVNLPYMSQDGAGNLWYVYNDGAVRQQMGPMGPGVYQQGGILTIDGNNFSANNNQGNVAKNGELVLRSSDMGDVNVTRRIFIDKEHNYVRFVDILHNPSAQDASVSVTLQTSLNWGVTQGQMIADPKHKDQMIAWGGMTNMGRAVLEVYGGSGGKLAPTINWQQGSNVVTATFQVAIPARKDAAIMHLHMYVPTLEAANQFVSDLNTARLVRTLTPEARRALVNFSAQQDWMSDLAILRGGAFDIVELRGGDELMGTLTASTYKLTTFYGPVELSPDHVVAIMNIATSPPRQLLVTDDGEIFGGRLDDPTIGITLSSGQTVNIPLDQISRVGYRKRSGEPEEWTFDHALVLMREGDRVQVDPPTTKIQAATRYGTLDLDPAMIAAISFQPDDGGVHEIYLSDGSKIAGLICDNAIAMKLTGTGPAQTVEFPVAGMSRIQFAAKMPDPDSDGPSLTMSNQDLLCGALEGTLSLQTAFDVINLDSGQIRHISRRSADAKTSAADLQVTLWDGSVIDGWVSQPAAQCLLTSGVTLNVPIGLLSEYNQPNPLPAPELVKQMEAAAADLNADDWRQRDRAQATLSSMGPAVIGVLRRLRPTEPPEAQQRIDAIIKKLQPIPGKPAPASPNPDVDTPQGG